MKAIITKKEYNELPRDIKQSYIDTGDKGFDNVFFPKIQDGIKLAKKAGWKR